MRVLFRTVAAIALAIIVGVGFSRGWGQGTEKKQETEKSSPAEKPGAAEMKRISSLYVGNWSYKVIYPKSGVRNTGVYTSKPGPGGNSLVKTSHSKGPAGEFEGMTVFTWDLAENKYKGYVFFDAFPGAIVETGAFEGEKLVFRGEFPSSLGTKVQIRSATWLDPSGKLVREEFLSRSGAQEILFLRVEAVKE
jgi:hypothetical protein